jgi:hypothetical protein
MLLSVLVNISNQCIIHRIYSNKGYAEISTKLLKISANYICSPLTYICNKSISTGIFPEQLKYSITKPVYKRGHKTDP